MMKLKYNNKLNLQVLNKLRKTELKVELKEIKF